MAKAFGRDNECHGWLGIKYQSHPGYAVPQDCLLWAPRLSLCASSQLPPPALAVRRSAADPPAFRDAVKAASVPCWLFVHRSQPSTVMMHTRMLDGTAQLQQEALGVLGVNFVSGVLSKGSDFGAVIAGLADELSRDRIEVCDIMCIR